MFVCCSIEMLYYHIIVLFACLNILPNPQPAIRDLKWISNICCVIYGSLRWIVDLVINQTDGYLFSGRDFLPQVQIRLTITTDQPSPKDLIVELRILSSTYIRAYMWVLPESNIGFSDQWAKVNFGHSADKAKTHFLKKGHSPQQRWLKFCVWTLKHFPYVDPRGGKCRFLGPNFLSRMGV